LHRLNTDSRSVEEHLVAALERHDFPNGAAFLARGLRDGTLMCLFDGLDEVFSDRRAEVVAKLREFCEANRRCRAVITCRTVVYSDDFSDLVDATLSVSEFSDLQIRRFLQPWEPDMPESKSADQLMQTLRDRPRIMVLARNPLLLTIIAYLYTDTNRILPQSRADFYKISTGIFLEQWHEQQNKFPERDKRTILRELALRNQDGLPSDGADRLSVPYHTVLEQVRSVIPQLDLPRSQEPGPLIAEIVERSGLLLEIDGGERIQFSHLTLQEYFAAEALLSDDTGLLARFSARHDTWRETVKLWCGLAGDSTRVIAGVGAIEQHTAFECLADAVSVEADVASRVIATMEQRLGDAATEPDVARAFAALASGRGERSQRVFDFLSRSLQTASDADVKSGAVAALSMTNLPQAAQLIGGMYDAANTSLRASLVRMGDLALPILLQKGREGVCEALDDVALIATPTAAVGLAAHMESHTSPVDKLAAWRLGTLLAQPGVTDALANRTGLLTHDRYASVWEPFGDPRSRLDHQPHVRAYP
jgi:hypothetical protein